MTRLYSDNPLSFFQVYREVCVSERTRLQNYKTILVEKLETCCVVALVIVYNYLSDDTILRLYAGNPSIGRVDV